MRENAAIAPTYGDADTIFRGLDCFMALFILDFLVKVVDRTPAA